MNEGVHKLNSLSARMSARICAQRSGWKDFQSNGTRLKRMLMPPRALFWGSDDFIACKDERTVQSYTFRGAPRPDSPRTTRPVFFHHPSTASPNH